MKLTAEPPEGLDMPPELVEGFKRKGIQQTVERDLNKAISQADVLYMTRVQKERFKDLRVYEAAAKAYTLTTDTMRHAKPRMVVMHPLPRCALAAQGRSSRFRGS